jgi:phosphoserine phosphatase
MGKQIVATTTESLLAEIQSQDSGQLPYVFDCDGTLIRGDIASLTAWALIRLGLVHPELLPPEWESEFKHLPFDYQAFKRLRQAIVAVKGVNAIYEWEAFLHAGLPPKTSLDTARFAVKEGLANKNLALQKPLADLARKMGPRTWICSGSPDVCVWAIAEQLGLEQKQVVATELETVDDIYAARIKPPGIVWEELKREALAKRNVKSAYFVAGDTIGDWAMFDMSTRWCWCVVWGPHRHRGEEFRQIITDRVLKAHGLALPEQSGFYRFNDGQKDWVFEIL